MIKKINYWKRIISAYLFNNSSQLSFWHEEPKRNNYNKNELSQYYMVFSKKADYKDILDHLGVPLLNYHGVIGKQYNPIAISQWGLGNYNKWKNGKDEKYYDKFIISADWLVKNLKKNSHGIYVWMHEFDFEYRDLLESPWYSGLAQGQGLSVLVRAYKETQNDAYLRVMKKILISFKTDVRDGGVNYKDNESNLWIEEYIVNPPTHILNGFIWGMWGLRDYYIYFNDKEIKKIFNKYSETISKNLGKYDLGYWSRYEISGTFLPMIASKFYHKLHICQLKIMFDLTKEKKYKYYSDKWENYLNNRFFNLIALFNKIIFKVFYY
jgi:heparosan-N-sulfate-glucuronate 5-epimerase